MGSQYSMLALSLVYDVEEQDEQPLQVAEQQPLQVAEQQPPLVEEQQPPLDAEQQPLATPQPPPMPHPRAVTCNPVTASHLVKSADDEAVFEREFC